MASTSKVVKIHSSHFSNNFPTQPFNSALPLQVELNFSNQLPSSRSGSPPTLAIPGLDFPVFTTDSQQSSWLPSSSTSLPALSAQQQHLQHLDLPNNQQDFVLFDQPINHRQPNRRSVSSTSANGRVNQNKQQQPQNQQFFQQQTSSPNNALQNQRVANIIQATGHQTTSSAFTNRFSSSAQNQFYASSAPSSSVALNPKNQQRPARPPVPLFPQSTGNIQQGKMDLPGTFHHSVRPDFAKGSHLHSELDLDDFTAFEGGASTTAYSSPAVPSVFDLNVGSVPSSTNMGTVSPQDLLIQEPFMSTPNSALTALTSPSIYNDSPDFGDGFDVSPHFGSHDFDNSPDVWFPLFPQANPTPQPQQQDLQPSISTSESCSPAAEKPEELEVTEPTSNHHRRKSSTSPSTRHSSVAGVNSRRRDKPLPPIIVDDPSDVVAMKRARNTLAARKSRERKAQRMEELEEKIEKLTAERDHWRNLALARGAQE